MSVDATPNEPVGSEPAPPKATEDNAVAILNPEDIFPDGCERYQKDCCCCHCVDMRCTMKRIAYLQTPEGRDRLELKMHLKNFFMDINAMTQVRRQIEEQLHGTKDLQLSRSNGNPISIVNVSAIDSNCMIIDWVIHDTEDVSHYEIFVDCKPRKRVFSKTQKSTVVLDINMKCTHSVRMRAVPTKGLGHNAHPVDRLVKDLMTGGLKLAMKGDYFCQCGKDQKAARNPQKENMCQTSVDYWEDSEYLYEPHCTCAHKCECLLFR